MWITIGMTHPFYESTTTVLPFVSSVATSDKHSSLYIDESVERQEVLLQAFKKQEGSTFHLLTHGASGKLWIANEWKDPVSIENWLTTNQLLKNKTHLNIYGCEFAKGEKGRKAVAYLKETLGISIAASDDITGIGGDWELEIGNATSVITVPNYASNLQCSPSFVAKTENQNSSPNISLNVPTGAAIGNLLITVIVSKEGSTTAPSGWTEIIDAEEPPALAVYWRLVDGTESSSYTFNRSGSEEDGGVMLLYSEVNTSNPISGFAVDKRGNNNSTNWRAPDVSVSTSNNLVIRMGGILASNASWVWPGTTTRASLDYSQEGRMLVGDALQASSGNTGTATITQSSSWIAGTVVIEGGNCGSTCPSTPITGAVNLTKN